MDKILENRIFLLSEYLKEHPSIYEKFEEDFIINFAKNNLSIEELIPSSIREIYDELGLLPENQNLYIGFLKLVDEIFDIKNRNILEVGGGVLPRLGERIATIQDRGSITVFDPRISKYKENNDKLRLVRKTFDSKIKVESIDLIIGLMPCKAAEVIVECAIKNNLDFIVALCEGGMHGEGYDYFEDDEEWRNSLIKYTSRKLEYNNQGKLKIKYMNEYNNPYPVIYNERD